MVFLATVFDTGIDVDIAILGFGRFGRALADLVRLAGHGVRAHDPGVPEATAPTAEAAVSGADVVVLAVPVGILPDVLAEIRPLLGPDQLVIDVGSVKQRPIEAMERTLGVEVPWIGTHPLFGPASLARGERLLDVVVCPNPLHPAAQPRIRELLESIGCRVVETDAETHDRLMARTHAMAFFLAKGLLELGIDDQAPFSPPSFKAMARTVETVRSDAGHLFASIQLDNPHAATVRRRFIDALQNIDEELETEARSPDRAARALRTQESLAIPGLGDESPDLLEARELIDEVDRALLVLMGQRIQLASRVRHAKAQKNQGVRDPRREEALLKIRKDWGELHDLDPVGVQEVFEALMRQSRRVQRVLSGSEEPPDR